jgi:hypothetical protein
MQKLAALSAFLINKGYTAVNQFDAMAEDCEVLPLFRDDGEGFTLYELKYTAAFYFDNFNSRQRSALELFAQIVVWLNKYDPERYDSDDLKLYFDIDVQDDDVADVEFKVDFTESVGIVPDVNGPIDIAGERYRLDDVPVWVATEGEVVTND